MQMNEDLRGLTISIVVYRPDQTLLLRTLRSLSVAGATFAAASQLSMHLYLVDNGGLPDISSTLGELEKVGLGCTVLSGHGNVGYGCGHNLAIERVASRYHLILNPDIEMEPDVLVRAMTFMNEHIDAGLLAPAVVDDSGQVQYLCRQFPTLTDLFVRGFMPRAAQSFFAARLARYEMRAQINERDMLWDPPIISGCFMLFRTDVLRKLAGFDARYFLYFEDYDLSLRAHDVARVVYVPTVRVLHHGGGASRKGFAHIRMFVASAFKFFNRFGWKWF